MVKRDFIGYREIKDDLLAVFPRWNGESDYDNGFLCGALWYRNGESMWPSEYHVRLVGLGKYATSRSLWSVGYRDGYFAFQEAFRPNLERTG